MRRQVIGVKKLVVILCVAGLAAGLACYCWARSDSGSEEETESEIKAAEVVYGKIKEINGNEMLLAVGTLETASPGGFDRGEAAGAGDAPVREGSGSGVASAGPGGDRAAAEGNAAAGRTAGEAPAENAPASAGAGSGSEAARSDRTAQGRLGSGGAPDPFAGGGMNGISGMGQTSITLTGEERTYVIPVTCPITSGEGERAQTVRFTQLAVKNVVKLSFNKTGDMVAVQVMQ